MIGNRDSPNLAQRPVEARVVELLEQIASDMAALRVAVDGHREPDQLLGAREVARLLGIDPRTLRQLRHEGKAPRSLRIGRSPKWRASDIEAWLAKGARP